MKHIYMFLLFVLTVINSFSQDTLTNKSVIKLKEVGLGTDIIKAKIFNSPCKFSLNTDDLIALKKSGVTDDIISSMIAKNGQADLYNNMLGTAKKVRSDIEEATDERNNKNDEAGIYYQSDKQIKLEPSIYSQSKTGAGVLASMTGGIAKTKMTETISGSHANLQVKENKPIFQFIFNTGSNDFGNQNSFFNNATSPNEFILIKFNSKKNREIVTGSYGVYSGVSSGIDDKNKVDFKFEKISAGVYKVFFQEPLQIGEYGFMYAGSASNTQKVYDFGMK